MRRGGYIALLVVACVAGLALLAWLNRPQDAPTRATVGDAVRSFRADGDPGKHREGRGAPAPGVYRYATRGSESVRNSTVGGATHDYRGISTITLTAGHCGGRERWQVLAGRWSEAESCPQSHGKARTTVREFHEFFGAGQEDLFRCRGASVSAPQLRRPGTRISSSCSSDNSSISTTAKVVGAETISVGGKRLRAIHSASRSVLGGGTSGTARRDDWRRRSDGLLLRRSASSEAETSAGGGTQYSEHYTLQLLAVTPRR